MAKNIGFLNFFFTYTGGRNFTKNFIKNMNWSC